MHVRKGVYAKYVIILNLSTSKYMLTPPLPTCVHASRYCIVGNFGEVFNLVIGKLGKDHQIKNSPI